MLGGGANGRGMMETSCAMPKVLLRTQSPRRKFLGSYVCVNRRNLCCFLLGKRKGMRLYVIDLNVRGRERWEDYVLCDVLLTCGGGCKSWATWSFRPLSHFFQCEGTEAHTQRKKRRADTNDRCLVSSTAW